MGSGPIAPPARPGYRLLTAAGLLALSASLGGCAVIAVADLAASAVVGTAGLAVDAAVGTARLGGKAIGKTADVLMGE
ncbi:MAG: hypothetical protein Q8K24_01565 [Hydrogenophaga sp.]|nr:hypothetical protein [Hydrogenophaga sp.]